MHQILCFGDSNSFGTMPVMGLGQAQSYPVGQRWPDVMAERLPNSQVIVQGQPGRTTLHDDPIEGAHRNGFRVLPAVLESYATLDLVILKLGTNDLKARFSVTPQDIALSCECLIAEVRARAKNAKGQPPQILLVCPPPIQERGALAQMFQGGAVKSLGLSEAYGAAAKRAGVLFFDAGVFIAVSDIDGIHYSAQSHAVLGAALADFLGSNFFNKTV